MRKIDKGRQPVLLDQWKHSHPHSQYADLSSTERRDIRERCISEQYGLCAYCTRRITIDSSHNEHIEAQNTAPDRTLDFSNIVASCNNKKQCGCAHGSDNLPLTPLMPECETELEFLISGQVKGLSDRACIAIDVLRLGKDRPQNRDLVGTRKQMIDALIYSFGLQPTALPALEDDDLLEVMLNDLETPQHQQLSAFSPVLANIIRNLLS